MREVRRTESLSPAVAARIYRAGSAVLRQKPTERLVKGGRVVVVPAPGGVVRLVGLSDKGEWIAEFSCRESEFEEVLIDRMAGHVARATGVKIAVVV